MMASCNQLEDLQDYYSIDSEDDSSLLLEQ